MSDYPNNPPDPSLVNPDLKEDVNNEFTEMYLGDYQLPMPTSIKQSPRPIGAKIELPNGDFVWQNRYRSDIIEVTWGGMSYKEQHYFRRQLRLYGTNVVKLWLPTPKKYVDWNECYPRNVCVKPDGESSYSSVLRYNVRSKSSRWAVTMRWRQVPQTGECVVDFPEIDCMELP